jgi:hypothetical protein
MSLKLRSTKEQFVVYEEKTAVVFQQLFWGFICFLIGVYSVYLGVEIAKAYFPTIFGCIFILAGFFVLLQLFNTYRKLEREEGFISLKANKKGLSLAAFFGPTAAVDYEWNDIAKIILTKNLDSIETDESHLSKNQIIFYFQPHRFKQNQNFIKNIFELNKYHIQKSPYQHYISFIPFPKNQTEIVKNELTRFAPENISIAIYNRVTLDNKKKIETFEN